MKKNYNFKRVAVIGAGASGLVAAISARIAGNDVFVLEKKEQAGKKILITGNGRCNLSNSRVSFTDYYGENPRFVKYAIQKFSQKETIKFFKSIGLATYIDEEGRIFPTTNNAKTVVEILLDKCEDEKIPILTSKPVKEIKKNGNKFEITLTSGKRYKADAVIVATGGKSFPLTGSSGDGYEFAKRLGHKVIDPFPVSVPLKIKSDFIHKLQGVKCEIELTVKNGDKILLKNIGIVMFSHFGISGPVVLESSRQVSKLLFSQPGIELDAIINFFPRKDILEVEKIIKDQFAVTQNRTVLNSLGGLMSKKIVRQILIGINVDLDIKVNSVTKMLRKSIVNELISHKERIIGTLGFDEAQFTGGGVDTREINSITMESKIVKGLYFVGEVLDVDGRCGGYNLQWAWSSGFIAGSSIPKNK